MLLVSCFFIVGDRSSIGDANVAAEAESNQENVEDDTVRDEDCVLLSFIKAGKNKKRKKVLFSEG